MDLGFDIRFDRPWFLLLLLLLPVIWVYSFNSLAGLGRYRRWFAILLRSSVLTILVCALAQMQWQQKTDRLTVIYLLDQSESIPVEQRDLMLQYAAKEVKAHRRKNTNDMAGVIIFGTTAKIECAPFDGDIPTIGQIESDFDLNRDKTSIESALKLARASFPEGTARRVVVITDGNENIGDSLSVAQSMSEDGIGINVLPVNRLASDDVAVEKIVLPSELRRGQEFKARVVVNNQTTDPNAEPVKGRLVLTPTSKNSDLPVLDQPVVLEPGKNIIGFNHKIEQASVFTFEAKFVPDDDKDDLIKQNNRATAFSHVRGKGRVLLIEDGFYQGEFQNLIQTLQSNSIEVDVISTKSLYSSAAELLQYDSIILANVPRASGSDAPSDKPAEIDSFSNAQVQMLVDNCEQFGCGIVMIGGDRALGAGGWSNSPLEKAMPVDFQIKNDKVSAVGALALMMHGCEMANANYWQVQIAKEALAVLGPMDYCGVIDWSDWGGKPRWLWKLPKGVDRVYGNRKRMKGMISRMATGDMPDFNAPMKVMLSGLANVDASMKHVIIISDGDPTPPTNALLQKFVAEKIKISTCAVGTHGPAGSTPLKKIANVTGGRYYVIKDARALPQIYQREARRVAKPVIRESKTGFSVIPTAQGSSHEIMQGIEADSLPPFLGYVMTTIKKNSLVEQLALSNDPDDGGENSTLLATWRFGNGRATVFTSDGGAKWTTPWMDTSQYDKMFVQAIRHSMRPITESANFTVATEHRDGRVAVTVTALDENDEFINFLDIAGTGIGPDGKTLPLQFQPAGPGRYIAETAANGDGNFLASIFPGEGYERLTTGVNIAYSSEYSDRESNVALMRSLANYKPRGGEEGEVIPGDLTKTGFEQLLTHNNFTPTLTAAINIEDIWPLLVVLCGLTFVADVFIRRVAVSFEWVAPAWASLMSTLGIKREQKAAPASISRLQSRKAEIEKDIESRRAATKFEADPEIQVSGKQQLDDILASEIAKTPAPPPKIDREEKQEEDQYTSRLLAAKKKAQEKQNRGKNDD
jgi:uncharacterized membrane protein